MTRFHVVEVTPTLDTNAYADGDHLGTLSTIYPYAGETRGQGYSVLKAVSIVDQAKQSAEVHLHFFDQSPTIASSDNAALNITDAEMIDKHLGKVTVAAADYENLSASSVATKEVFLPVRPGADDGKVFLQLQSGGSPTYAASSLKLRLYFEVY